VTVTAVSTDALRSYWHPVAFSEKVTSTPRRATLLDERLVVYRTEGGTAAALRDLCIHRGTPLSLGSVEGEAIVCAYHGWSYDVDGRCLRIPSVPAERPIPPKARVDAYRTQERYGMVWVCLDEPEADVLDFPEYDDPGFHTFLTEDDIWNANAARLVENFIDSAHFAWVHNGLLGHKDKPLVPPITVSHTDSRIHVDFEMETGTAIHPGRTSDIHYEVGLPFTLRQLRTDPDGRQHIVFVAVCPVTRNRLQRFSYKMRNYDLDGPDDAYIERAQIVSEQDRAIVEEQRPEELPVDLTAELHIKGPDDPALVYRRTLAALGVEVH
jgi:phenylpropionate dioxygenase-like ring-hydroxylating dioxygenase large terminal subunit